MSKAEQDELMLVLTPVLDRQAQMSRRSQALLASAGQDGPVKRWYVITVHPGFDKAVDKSLDDACIERWMAAEKVVPKRHWGRAGKPPLPVQVPFFPGYIFVRVANVDNTWAGLRTIDGFAGVLGGFVRPAPLGHLEVMALKAFVEDDPAAIAILTDAYKAGQKVRVEDGPFATLEGIVEEVLLNGRVVIEVMIFGRTVRVDLALAQISKL